MFAEVLRQNPDGSRRLPFVPQDMVDSESQVTGDHWADWLGSECPALPTAGSVPPCMDQALANEMVAKRPNVTLGTGHFVHKADPAGFAKTVRDFLESR
jgi:pimeloyl-ACP methyl ester carboxylesterase